ncbi:Catechol O-methyltransferase [Phytophthora citrophthora]|uniref:catechol O-methyltransferase n=1 Tax=Phytophthora citrophthora TaxID=4793 RepID=A0AAD9G1K8_9STRA|nr:Catechol O-methyltransferase [Phytophthora citrophthora]
MNGELVDREIAKVKPKILVELGGLFGYSAIRFASQMRELSGQSVHVYSIEISPVFAATATKMVEFAGLSSFVTIFVGTFQDTHAKLQALGVDHVDVFFLDHDKKCYKSDLQLIEESGLLRPGSVVMADNVVVARITDYLDYVRGHAKFQSVMYNSYLEYSDIEDALEVSTYVG